MKWARSPRKILRRTSILLLRMKSFSVLSAEAPRLKQMIQIDFIKRKSHLKHRTDVQICSWQQKKACLNSHVYWRCRAGLWSYSLYWDEARYKWTPQWSHSLSFERLESYRCPLQISFHTPGKSTGREHKLLLQSMTSVLKISINWRTRAI